MKMPQYFKNRRWLLCLFLGPCLGATTAYSASNPANTRMYIVGNSPIYVKADANGYVGIARDKHPLDGVKLMAYAMAVAPQDHRINSWKAAIVLTQYGASFRGDLEAHVDSRSGAYGESYASKPKRKRPRDVKKDVFLTVDHARLDSFAVQVCNAHANQLRQQNTPDAQIYGRDQTIKLGVYSEGKSVVVRDGQVMTHFVSEGKPEADLNLICMKRPGPDVSGMGELQVDTGVTDSSLTVMGQSTLGGACKVHLSTMVTTNVPNTKVKFRFEHTNGNLSDVKTVETSHTKTATDAYWYDVPFDPNGDEMGSIRMVGVSHQFTSDWKTYHMTCNKPSTGEVATTAPPVPPKRTSVKPSVELLLEPTAKVMQRGMICPTKVKVTAKVHSKMAFTGTGLVHMKQGGHAFAQHDVQLSPFIVWQHVDEFDLKPWSAVNASAGMAGGARSLHANAGSANTHPTQRFELRYVLTNNQAPVVTTPFKTIAISCVDPKVNAGIRPATGLSLDKPEPPQQTLPRPMTAGRQDFKRPEDDNKPRPVRVAPATLQVKPPAAQDEPRQPKKKAPKPQMRTTTQPGQTAQGCHYDPNSARWPCPDDKRKPMTLINPFE